MISQGEKKLDPAKIDSRECSACIYFNAHNMQRAYNKLEAGYRAGYSRASIYIQYSFFHDFQAKYFQLFLKHGPSYSSFLF